MNLKTYLKENGIDTKGISIKHRYCGYSESYDITIKDININKKQVEQLVKQFENIDYDQATGEILKGGNTYIFVAYDYDVISNANDELNPKVLDIVYNQLKELPEEQQEAFYNGECNPVLKLSDKVILYRNGKAWMIRNLNNLDCYSSSEYGLAKTLIEMGLLDQVI